MARLLVLVALGLTVTAALAAPPPVALTGKLPSAPVVGKPFVVRFSVRGATKAALVARGPGVRTFAARRLAKNRFSATVRLSARGRWTISARVRGRLHRLGQVVARPAGREPLVLSTPALIVARPDGSLLLAEGGRNRVVAIDPARGQVSVVAGRGGTGTSGDGGPALQADIGNPYGVALAPTGDVYVTSDRRVRRIDPSGRITTVGTTPTEAGPLAVDGQGNVFFASEAWIFRIAAATGVVETYAGTGTLGPAGDGGPAVTAQVNRPHGLMVAADGALLVADTNNERVRRIDPVTRIITTAWTGMAAAGLCADSAGTPLVTDFLNHRVSRLAPTGPVVVAGNGSKASRGDGGPATAASLDTPNGCATAGGKTYVVESGGTGTIRVLAADGTISTLSRSS
jgi:streptogramin lyase